MLMKAAKTKETGLGANQKGFAAIVIALVLVLVLSLLTVGFAELMRTETRSALDKQLASQAYYAAESGINDAAAVISNNPTYAKTTCGPTAPGPGSPLPNNKVGNNTGASYPCLLINPTPLTLQYTIGTQQSTVAEFQAVDSAGNPKAVASMLVSWEDTGSATNFASASNCNGAASNTFSPAFGASAWNHTGILRTQLISLNDLSRAGLAANTYTAFFCPQSGSGTPTTQSAYTSSTGTNGGSVVGGNCNSTVTPPNARLCNVKITGLASLNESTFFLDMRSIYAPTNVTITLFGADIASTQLNISQAQILVDSTGKAQDVLKRIQVRIPAHNGYAIPDDGTQSMESICKQLQVVPASVSGSVRGGGSECTP